MVNRIVNRILDSRRRAQCVSGSGAAQISWLANCLFLISAQWSVVRLAAELRPYVKVKVDEVLETRDGSFAKFI